MKHDVIKPVESDVEKRSTVRPSSSKDPIRTTSLAETDFTLDDLLAKITEKNLHDETDVGFHVGKEAW